MMIKDYCPSDVTRAAGEYLRQLRELNRYTLKSLGALVDLSHSQISRIETGRQSPTLDQLADLSAALGAHVQLVFTSPNLPPSSTPGAHIQPNVGMSLKGRALLLDFNLLAPKHQEELLAHAAQLADYARTYRELMARDPAPDERVAQFLPPAPTKAPRDA